MKNFLLNLWGLYATLILQYNKNTRRAYLILSIALHDREVAFKRIGIFFSMHFLKKDKQILSV